MKNILVLLLGLFLVACGGDSKKAESSNTWSSGEEENFYIECDNELDRDICECVLDELVFEASYAEFERALKRTKHPTPRGQDKDSRELIAFISNQSIECIEKREEEQDNRRDRGRRSYSSVRSVAYAKEAELNIKNMAKSASIYILSEGYIPPDCWETMKEEGFIEIKQAVTENWEFECAWELDDVDGITGTITATSTDENDAGAGKVIEYQIETEEFTGYGQGNSE